MSNKKQIILKWILAFQHLLSALGATVLVPLILGISPSTAIFAGGVGTLIFHLVTKRKIPVYLGSSFAYITPSLAILSMYNNDFGYVQGGIICIGLLYCLMSFIVHKVESEKIIKYIPRHVTGSIVIVIGLTLFPSAINNASSNWIIAFVTLGTSLLFLKFGKGILKQLGVLIGLTFGYILCLSLGLVDTTAITNATLISAPILTLPKFSINAILIIIPFVLSSMMEHIGDVTTNGAVVGKNFIKDLDKTLLGDGLATMFAGMIGAPVNTTYSENTAVLSLTKNYNPKILRMTAILAIILSFVGYFSATIISIPQFVIGGISIQLYLMIAWVGLKNIIDSKCYKKETYGFDLRNILIIVITIAIGLSGVTVFGLSGVALSSLVSIVLNIILNRKRM